MILSANLFHRRTDWTNKDEFINIQWYVMDIKHDSNLNSVAICHGWSVSIVNRESNKREHLSSYGVE